MLSGQHNSARPRGLSQPENVPLARGQFPPPILAFWEVSFLANPCCLHLALPKSVTAMKRMRIIEMKTMTIGYHTASHCFTCSSSKAKQKGGQNTEACGRHKKIKKQQAEVFCCSTGHTAVCLVLSINTDMKKLNKYKRWSNAIDKESSDFLSSLQQYTP